MGILDGFLINLLMIVMMKIWKKQKMKKLHLGHRV